MLNPRKRMAPDWLNWLSIRSRFPSAQSIKSIFSMAGWRTSGRGCPDDKYPDRTNSPWGKLTNFRLIFSEALDFRLATVYTSSVLKLPTLGTAFWLRPNSFCLLTASSLLSSFICCCLSTLANSALSSSSRVLGCALI